MSPAGQSSASTLAEIEGRLGFVPPFFGPAIATPEVLENLWAQTLTAYLDSALPALFKEKLSAYLSRYCSAAYCLVCHTCSLRPMGMSGADVLDLLRAPIPRDADARALAQKLRDEAKRRKGIGTQGAFPGPGTWEEAAVISLASTIYLSQAAASVARAALAELLGADDYNRLLTLILYVKTCHGWVESQPGISFAVDARYQKNFRPLADEAPGLHRFFEDYLASYGQAQREDVLAQAEGVAESRAGEAQETIDLLEKRLLAVLEERRKAAEFAEELVAIVSHDLRNPLNAIQVGAGFLLRIGEADPRVLRTADRILSSTGRAARLVSDLLDFAKARVGGGIALQRVPADLHALTRRSVDEIQAAHPHRLIELEHRGDGAGEWDEDRLSQVLSNLLGNAVAHSPDDSVIRIESDVQEGRVRIRVRNANRLGPIANELLPVLFEPFKRGSSRGSKTGSVGLGLYIVRSIVLAHGGEVGVHSDEGATTFEVLLPRALTMPR